MTKEQVEELKKIQEEIEKYDKAIRVFDINKHKFLSECDKKEAIEKTKNPFGFLLECFNRNGENQVRLNPKGFFGGESVEVEAEFVDMCLEYFIKKRAECDKRFEAL